MARKGFLSKLFGGFFGSLFKSAKKASKKNTNFLSKKPRKGR